MPLRYLLRCQLHLSFVLSYFANYVQTDAYAYSKQTSKGSRNKTANEIVSYDMFEYSVYTSKQIANIPVS